MLQGGSGSLYRVSQSTSGIPKPKRAKNENEKVLWIMTPTTKCDGYFQNSLQPISYLSFIWNLYILGLKKQPNTQNHAQETMWVLAENTSNGPICLPKPKSLDFRKNLSLSVRRLWIMKI